MTVSIPPELEQAITETARQRGVTPEAVVLDTLRARFPPRERMADEADPLGEWERLLRTAADQVEAARVAE